MDIQSQKQNGFTLIEVLISVLIGAIGILGISAMQLTSLKSTNSSFYRSQASLFSNEIIDYMRANRTAASNQNYDTTLTELSSVTDPGAGGTIAAKEQYRWFVKMDAALPQAQASIDCDTNAICAVKIQWYSRIAQGTSEIIMSAQL